MAEGTTAMGRTRMHDIDLLSATETTTASDGGVGDLSTCVAATASETALTVSRVVATASCLACRAPGAGSVR